VMAGISTTILLGIAASGTVLQIPFASGSPHVPGSGPAILVPAAAYLNAALYLPGFGAAMGRTGSPHISLCAHPSRTLFMHDPVHPPYSSPGNSSILAFPFLTQTMHGSEYPAPFRGRDCDRYGSWFPVNHGTVP